MTAEEIKEKAIDATVARMRKEGFDKVRLIDIAKDLNLSHAALYAHFKDKTALLDAVSERWLLKIDESLEAVCRKEKDPVDKIVLWMLTLHRAKVAKVQNDPELYKAFDMSTAVQKPFSKKHMETMRRQLIGLVNEAVTKRRLKNIDPENIADILHTSMLAFHHPKLVAQYIQEKREPLLRQVLEKILVGLNLKS
jgi:AcrR family transcriptional regulator